MRVDNLSNDDFMKFKKPWPLLGEYLRAQEDTPHRQMLRKLTLGFWKEYSSLSHASFDGLLGLFPFISVDCVPHEIRESILDAGERHITMHLGRAAGLLLCLLTEIQAYYRFEGANINARLHEIWRPLNEIPEVHELFDYRYRELMKARGITDRPSDPGVF